jgi:hypothetical protein
MRYPIAVLAAILVTAAASPAGAALAWPQLVARASEDWMPITAVRYLYGRHFAPRCCVMGPAYGRPGEPLGPAYNTNEPMSDPRTCGPGACQDNPYY